MRILGQAGTTYAPTSLLTDTSTRKRFYGSVDPFSVGTLGVGDEWWDTATTPTPSFTPLVADAGALPIGTANYAIPSGAIFVSPAGNDSSGDGSVGSPYATLGKACSRVAANGTIVMRAGSYHEGTMNGASNGVTCSQTGVTIQNYPGEAVWMEGSSVKTGWITDTTSVPGKIVWRMDNWGINFDRSPTYSRGADDSTTVGFNFINPSYPQAPWPDQIFMDDVPMSAVASLSAVGPGQFYIAGSINGTAGTSKYQFTSTSAYIGTDPTGRTVRASDLATAFLSVGDNNTLRGIGFRRYAPSVCDFGTVKMWRANNVIENVYIQYTSNGALAVELRANQVVRKVTVDTAGLTGMKNSSCDNIVVDRYHAKNCNNSNFNIAPVCAGMKMTNAQYPTIKGSLFENSNCHGIWFDVSVLAPQVYSNNFFNMAGHGAICEISGGTGASAAGTVFADNLAVNCTKIGLYCMDSDAMRMWNNTVVGSTECNIDWNQDTRTPANTSYGYDKRQPYPAYYQTTMTWLPVSGQSCNNVSQTKPGSIAGLFRVRDNASPVRPFTAFGLTVDYNVYSRPSGSPNNAYNLINSSGSIVGYSSLTAMKAAAPSFDAHSVEFTSAVVDGSYRLTGSAASVTGSPLPADIAALIGQPAGSTQIGAYR